jgi:hypothetical protein
MPFNPTPVPVSGFSLKPPSMPSTFGKPTSSPTAVFGSQGNQIPKPQTTTVKPPPVEIVTDSRITEAGSYIVSGPPSGLAIRENELFTSPVVGKLEQGTQTEIVEECEVTAYSGEQIIKVTVSKLADGRGWVTKELKNIKSFLSKLPAAV